MMLQIHELVKRKLTVHKTRSEYNNQPESRNCKASSSVSVPNHLVTKIVSIAHLQVEIMNTTVQTRANDSFSF